MLAPRRNGDSRETMRMGFARSGPERVGFGLRFATARLAASLMIVNLLAACTPPGSAGGTAPPGGAALPPPDTIVVRAFHVATNDDGNTAPGDLGARTAQHVASAVASAFARSGVKVRTAPEGDVGCDKRCLYVDGDLRNPQGSGARPATVNLLYGVGGDSPDLLSTFPADSAGLPDTVALAVARTFVEHHWVAPQH